MSIIFTHKLDEYSITFFCEDNGTLLPVDEWWNKKISLPGGDQICLGILNFLLEEEKALESDDGLGVTLPHSVVAGLEAWQVKGLGLPPIAPFRLVIETHNTLASEKFSISYAFTHPDSFPVTEVLRLGAVITCGNKQYILPDPLYSVVKLLDEYKKNPIKDMDERFLWWAQLRELLPDETEVSNFLRTINIIKPESFTIDFKEDEGDITITPRFVIPPELASNNNSAIEEDKEPENIIPDVVHEEFVNTFLRHSSTKTRYALSKRWFIVVSPALRTALQAVREINDAPREKRRAFIHNPRTELRQRLEGLLDEAALETIFIETPLFLSERIKCLGIWQPKANLYIKTDKEDWLPQDGAPKAVGIPIDDAIYTVNTEDVPPLLEAIKKARNNGHDKLFFNEQSFPVNEKSIKAIEKIAQSFIRTQPPKKSDDKAEPKVSPTTEVPIIYDHIEELGIIVDEHGFRSHVYEGKPALGSDIRLHDHQKAGLSWLQERWRRALPGSLLADDMGLGKTLQTLAFLSWVKLQMDNGCTSRRPFLVVAPTGLLKNWEAEANKFLRPSALGLTLKAHGSGFKTICQKGWRVAASKLKEAGWVLTTYETLRDKILAFTGVEWAVTVFDEAQKIKNPRAMVTDMSKSLKSEFTLALTGTPVENSLADLWCIIDTVQPAKLGTLKEFVKKYMPNGKAAKNELLSLKNKLMGQDEQIKISCPVMIRRSKDEHWKEKPKKYEQLHERIMPQVQADAYSAIIDKASKAKKRRGAMLEALQAMRAISLHPFMQDDPTNYNDFITSSARLQATFAILDDIHKQGEKALLFVEYLRIQSILSDIIGRRYNCKLMIINGSVSGAKRKARIDKFQKEKTGFDVMILSPKAGGVGLNLTAATHVIHLSRWWNPAVEDQCSDRAYRIGQTKPVTIHYPLAIHPEYGRDYSFDKKLHDLLEKKRHLSHTLLAPPAGTEADIKWLYVHSVERKS